MKGPGHRALWRSIAFCSWAAADRRKAEPGPAWLATRLHAGGHLAVETRRLAARSRGAAR